MWNWQSCTVRTPVKNVLCLPMTNVFPLAHVEWVWKGRFLLLLQWIRLLRLFALSRSCFISVHKQQGILLQDVFVIAVEAGVGQSRQVRLENLVKVFLGTRCFPMRSTLPSTYWQHCLLCLGILFKCFSWKTHPFILLVKNFSVRMMGDPVSCFKGKSQCAVTVL